MTEKKNERDILRRLKRFELTYRNGRKLIVRAKSYRTLERRLSPDERDNCLIKRVS